MAGIVYPKKDDLQKVQVKLELLEERVQRLRPIVDQLQPGPLLGESAEVYKEAASLVKVWVREVPDEVITEALRKTFPNGPIPD